MRRMNQPDARREEAMRAIRAHSLAVLECNLYLDTHPRDEAALSYYNAEKNELRALVEAYEKEFSDPLRAKSAGAAGTFEWVTTPWPWEKEA